MSGIMMNLFGSSFGPVAGPNIESLFHTQVYTGSNANQQVTNGIDLSNEGGLLWFKSRSNADSHRMIDTERGLTKSISSHLQAQETSYNASYPWLTTFADDGYTIGNQNDTNYNGYEYVGWTFRKAKKFFDVVKYTGNETARTISHNLGSVPGMIMVKNVSANGTDWRVWHRSLTSDAYALRLNLYNGEIDSGNGSWNSTAPTSSVFSVGGDFDVNRNNDTHVAYLFAHNDNDGGFGETGDKDIIKCGKYTGGSGNTKITLGFEPQWILIKKIDTSNEGEDWYLIDNMRGMLNSGDDQVMRGERFLTPNGTSSEGNTSSSSYAPFTPLADGFKVRTGLDARVSSNGGEYIYVAIRRGPMAIPTNVRDVFDTSSANTNNEPNYGNASGSHDGFPVDMAINIYTAAGTSNRRLYDRMRSDVKIHTDSTGGEQNGSGNEDWDYMDGFEGVNSSNYHAFMWRRAPGYFDTVMYDGTGSATTFNHNLGVVPEMMWVKKRNGNADWTVYHKALGATKYLEFNNYAAATNSARWNDTAPTASVFSVGDHSNTNYSGDRFVAWLFATAPGVSFVGSYTGDGTYDGSNAINCGFSNGIRYVLFKRTDTGGSDQDWWFFDTERGLTSGADTRMQLNTTASQYNGINDINSTTTCFDFRSAGGSDLNINNATYIFYAIAYPS